MAPSHLRVLFQKRQQKCSNPAANNAAKAPLVMHEEYRCGRQANGFPVGVSSLNSRGSSWKAFACFIVGTTCFKS